MIKFFKISGLWVVAFLAPLVLTAGFAYIGWESLAKIAIAILVGYIYLLGMSFFFTGLGEVPIRKVSWGAVAVHILSCSIVSNNDWMFVVGPILGIAICYGLMKRSGGILDSQLVTA